MKLKRAIEITERRISHLRRITDDDETPTNRYHWMMAELTALEVVLDELDRLMEREEDCTCYESCEESSSPPPSVGASLSRT